MEEAAKLNDELYPAKSRDKYREEYNKFVAWQKERNLNCYEEEVFLVNFSHLYTNYAPTTVQSHHSMVKAVLKTELNIDIGKFEKVNALLKRKSVGYQLKKAHVFEPHELKKFLCEAPDIKFLATKVNIFFYYYL